MRKKRVREEKKIRENGIVDEEGKQGERRKENDIKETERNGAENCRKREEKVGNKNEEKGENRTRRISYCRDLENANGTRGGNVMTCINLKQYPIT